MKEQIRWGIVGCAGIAENQVIPGIMASANGMVAAVASRNPDKAAGLAAKFGIQTAYDSYEALLNDQSIDAVYIPLPNHLHAEWTIRAAEAGKHVLCEKPAAMDAAEAERMELACREHNVLLEEAFMYRNHSRWDRVLEIVRSGLIGELSGISSRFTYNMPGQKQNIRFQSAVGGGALYDVGCYCLHTGRLITGSEPLALTAHARFDQDDPLVDLATAGLVEFLNGVSLTFDCGMVVESRNEVEIVGSKGKLDIPRAYNCDKNGSKLILTIGGEQQVEEFPAEDHFRNQAERFADAVLNGSSVPYPFSDAILNMKALEAGRRSIREGIRVSL